MTGPDHPSPASTPTKGIPEVSDRTALTLHPDDYASALQTLSDLILSDRVEIIPDWDSPSRPAIIDRVRIDVTACPTERDELLALIGNPVPREWASNDGTRQHRDWRGEILTMAVMITETLGEPTAEVDPEPTSSDPDGDAQPADPIVPTPSPVPSCEGAPANFEGDCGEPGPHGPHALGDEPPVTSAAIVLRPATPTEAAWLERIGLVQADASHYADPATAEAWRRYAMARARYEFEDRTFTTPTAALAALDAWPGREMLTEGDVSQLAGEMLAIPPAPERSRPRPYVRWPWSRTNPRGPRPVAETEHIAASGRV